MNKFANFLLDLKQKRNKNEIKNYSYNRIQKILVLTNQTISFKDDSPFRTAEVLYNSSTNPSRSGNYIIIHDTDFNYFGKCRNPDLQFILNKNYDIFIDFHTENSEFLKYLYRKIDATCKVSFKKENWVDIHIETTQPLSKEYFNEVYKVLTYFK